VIPALVFTEIWVTGPTGSGKSTLMYQMVMYAQKELNLNVISIEDPVEQRNTYFAISASLISPIKMTSGSHRSIALNELA
jgi:Tfp pilus assembly pilus retraction ATPase PilT